MGKKHRTSLLDVRPDGPSLRALADSLPLPVLLADPTGAPVHANDRFRAQHGTPPAAGWLDLVEPSERPRAEALWLAAGTALAPQTGELRLRGATGPLRASCHVAPLQAAGRLLGWSVVMAEVPEDRLAELRGAHARLAESESRRREAEDRLAASESRLRDAGTLLAREEGRRAEAEARHALAEGRGREAETCRPDVEARLTQVAGRLEEAEAQGRAAERALLAQLDAAAPMLWTARPDGIPGFVNESWRAFTGAGPDDDWLTLVHPEDRNRVLGLWGHAVSRGEPFEAEHRLRHRDGGHRPVLTRVRPAWDGTGTLLGWTGSCVTLPVASEADRSPVAPGEAMRDGTGDDEPDDEPAAAEAGERPADMSLVPDGPGSADPGTIGAEAGAPHPSGRLGGEEARRAPLATAVLAQPGDDRIPGPVLHEPAREAFWPAADPEERPEDGPELDRLAGRLRSPTLRTDLTRWRAARRGAALAHFAGWDEVSDASSQVVIEVDEERIPARLRIVRAPAETPLLRALTTPPGRDGHAWQRCAASGRPDHDYAQVGFGPQNVQSVERLLLPFSTDGARVDRLVLLMVTE